MTDFDGLNAADERLLEVARQAADAAARVHRGRSPAGREWGEKGRADFVTDVDLEAQAVILEAIGEAFPGHAIIAEEEDQANHGSAGSHGNPGDAGDSGSLGAVAGASADSPMRWIVDPLDGTTNWLHGYPEYAVSLAVEDDEGLRVGLVLNSATGERFEAARGAGARKDGEPIAVSTLDRLEMALVGTGFPFKKPEVMEDYMEVFRSLLYRTSGIRRGGSAALDLCDLACGRFDAFWEHWLMPWDVAAGVLIVREAGGTVEEFPVPGEDRRTADSFASRRGGAYLGSNAALRNVFREAVLGAEVPA